MNYIIVYAHPYVNSFNHAILDLSRNPTKKNHHYEIIEFVQG